MSGRKISLDQIIPTVCLLIIASSFFSLASSLCLSRMEKTKLVLHTVLRKPEEASHSPLSSSPGERSFYELGSSFSELNKDSLGHGTRQVKQSCLPLLPFFSYIWFDGVAKMSSGVFVGSSLVTDLCGRTGKLQSPILSLFPRILGLFYLLLIKKICFFFCTGSSLLCVGFL